ncbi:GNAT family N-acetyltransferase [Pseudalkalibacillus caeni]|uniref:GNAT family N-acetyltransferase n=1 Tax=Exobacillus caeni TaxID=2574798 RepID=A0A5R9F3X4_9BACL|nr:GNAT family N-acetyltransferase [Pseudalkalibacillus caeni]TLS37199.1 GNAT family N-acetyltransferase [Pseudalkalibacillus caeni]
MLENELKSIYDRELRRGATTPGFKREETDLVVRQISQFGEKGFVIYSNLNENNAREVIKHELEYFRSLDQEFEWKVHSYDKPDNLVDILQEGGFTVDDPEALMVMNLHDKHPLLLKKANPVIKEITDEKGIEEIISLEDEVWKVSHAELGERLWRDKRENPESLFLYGVYDGNRLVSAAWMYLENGTSFASMWGGSTLEGFRRKGYYSELLAIRAKKAYEEGYQHLTVDASPMSRPILEKCGFLCLAYSYGCQSPSFPKKPI